MADSESTPSLDFKTLARRIADGFCMGSADIVPGVSGGTVALILGIYEKLLAAVRSFDWPCVQLLLSGKPLAAIQRPHWHFILPLFAGIALSVVFFTRIVPLPTLIKTQPELVYGLFFGLILGSIYLLLRGLHMRGIAPWLQLAAGALIGWLVVNLVPATTPDASWFVFLSGAIAICAMLLPGISGSFLLLILGKYAYVLNAISSLKFSVVIPFAMGCATGLMLFSRFLGWLLARWHDQTMRVVTGFLVGSLWLIWPFQDRLFVTVRGKQKLLSSDPILPASLDSQTLAAFALAAIGILVVLGIARAGTGTRSSG